MAVNTAPIRTEVLDFINKSSGSQFVIPVYQRNYTWLPREETKKLLIDFEECLKNNNNHFLGILMYLPIQINFKFSQFQIIDGQQRLTTIFLILVALRELSFQNNDANSSIIDDYYLFNKHADENNKFRMKPLVRVKSLILCKML